MAGVMLVLGALAALVGGILVLNAAFKTSLLWGLASLFIPFGAFVYVAKHWDQTRRGFTCWIAGFALVVLALIIAPAAAVTDQSIGEEPRPALVEDFAPVASMDVEFAERAQARPAAPRREEPVAMSVIPEAAKKVQQVYVEQSSGRYWTESCKSRPASAGRVAKSVAIMQGYTEAPCD
ncbi:MAG TPA: hypothetical protein VF701_02600 [Thermoanaerobaculia bacterium]